MTGSSSLVPRTKSAVLCLIFVLLLSFPCLSWAWSGKVVGVTDGDTINVLNKGKEVKIRLYGIDCPEKGQAFGKKAEEFTSDMVFGKVVEVGAITIDHHGQTIGGERSGHPLAVTDVFVCFLVRCKDELVPL